MFFVAQHIEVAAKKDTVGQKGSIRIVGLRPIGQQNLPLVWTNSLLVQVAHNHKLRGEGSRTLAEAKKTRKFPCTILTGQLSWSRETGRQYQTEALANRR